MDQLQEFAAPGTCKELDCGGRPCAKCRKCRDWHFSGDQYQWNSVRNWENWKKVDEGRWGCEGLELFTKRDGATCRGAVSSFFCVDRALLDGSINIVDRVLLEHTYTELSAVC
ncbi:unnamed protein product [Adineta steineri]|uniref:Uncharacterized protein n=1 Tax=Adineta steineri TaxID=433720 RepID=A0A814AGW3_9BILA|nr:unnamed protein product [Adineta steineri]CAF0915077.1 unnamed protein product [Adineta steineri]